MKTLTESGTKKGGAYTEDKLPDFKGIYHIKIKSIEDYWISDSRFVSISDLGLIAKEGSDKITVFVNSIKTTNSLTGVNVVAYGSNNQLLGTGATNEQGVAEINYVRKDFAGFKLAMIIAKTEGDFNYLPFSNTRINTSRFGVAGKRSNSTGLDAFIYAERDIYRPGEKVNFAVVVRDKQWKTPGELTMKLKFLQPNGKELKEFRKTLNIQGGMEGSVDINASAITGSYTLEVYNGNDVLLANKNFMIEEFVPDRIKVEVKPVKTTLIPGEKTDIAINAVNFFGPPAANRNYECEIQLKQKSFSPKKFERYNFAIANSSISFGTEQNEGKTDEKGNANENFSIKEEYKNTGLLQAKIFATVFDETGRPVSRNANIDIYTQNVFFGIGEDGWWYYPLNQVIKVPLLALDKSEKLISAQEKVMVIKHEYRTVVTKNGDYFWYQSQKEERLISENNVTISGENTSYSFTPRAPGNYEMRVSIPGANSYVSKSFYSYGGWGGDNSSFEVSAEGNIDIEVDKASYTTGETVKALFKTPFSGKMLVTMETDKVISYQYVTVEQRTASVDLKLTTDHLPNTYITATLFKVHDVSDIPLTVAHG